MESIDLTDIHTCDLVEELKKREGVSYEFVEPYESNTTTVEGPAFVFVVID